LRAPGAGGPPVHEVRSPHFVVYSDGAEGRATELAATLEQAHLVLEHEFPYEPPFTGITEVFEFSERANLRFMGSDMVGLHIDQWEMLNGMTTIIVSGKDPKQTNLTAFHELTHAFVAHHMPSAPTWLNEGLAQYYQTMTFDAGKVSIGKHLLAHMQGQGTVYTTAIPGESTKRLRELEPLDLPHFYADADANYQSAWATVHALESEGYRPTLDEYIGLLQGGAVAASEAYAQTVGKLDQDAVRTLAADAVDNRRFEIRTAPLLEAATRDFSAPRSLSDPEALTLYARLVASSDQHLADELSAEAVRLAPKSADALVVRGSVLALPGGNPSAAADALLAAHAAATPAQRPRIAALIVTAVRATGSAAEQVESIGKALVREAKTAQELEAASRFLLGQGRTRAAFSFAKKSLESDGSRPSALANFAEVSAALEDYPTAYEYQRVAVNLLGHQATTAERARLAEYARKAGE